MHALLLLSVLAAAPLSSDQKLELQLIAVSVQANARASEHVGSDGWITFGPFAVHLGVRGSRWSDAVERVNGCSIDDLRAMDGQLRAAFDPATAVVTRGCGFNESNDIPLALKVVRVPRTEAVVNVAGELGLSWSFF